jgi:hypothetical protein
VDEVCHWTLAVSPKADPRASINIVIWAIALLCHAACKNFGGLFAARFVLGMCEGAITPGFMIVRATFIVYIFRYP